MIFIFPYVLFQLNVNSLGKEIVTHLRSEMLLRPKLTTPDVKTRPENMVNEPAIPVI